MTCLQVRILASLLSYTNVLRTKVKRVLIVSHVACAEYSVVTAPISAFWNFRTNEINKNNFQKVQKAKEIIIYALILNV
jgi:hypothetical protein